MATLGLTSGLRYSFLINSFFVAPVARGTLCMRKTLFSRKDTPIAELSQIDAPSLAGPTQPYKSSKNKKAMTTTLPVLRGEIMRVFLYCS